MPSLAPLPLTATKEILRMLRAQANPANVAGMARFGIGPERNFGVSVTELRKLARSFGCNQPRAEELWDAGYRETRILATLTGDPLRISETCVERWVKDLNSWDICDAACLNIFDRTPFAWSKPEEWSQREEEFVRRAAFALIAGLAVHQKKAPDDRFLPFFDLIAAAAGDNRNFVRKAVNWALRGIGKRSRVLNAQAIETAKQLRRIDAASARWIAADALRELQSDAVRNRLKR